MSDLNCPAPLCAGTLRPAAKVLLGLAESRLSLDMWYTSAGIPFQHSRCCKLLLDVAAGDHGYAGKWTVWMNLRQCFFN